MAKVSGDIKVELNIPIQQLVSSSKRRALNESSHSE